MKYFRLIVSIIICGLAGILGSFFTSAGAWYTALNKPSFNPPGWVFGPVWTILYLLMGISLYLVWQSDSKLKKTAVIIFSIQLILNAVWSPLFFGLKAPLAAFIDIAFLWLAIIATIIIFYRISKPASYLLVPYILWVSFASVLNLFIVILN